MNDLGRLGSFGMGAVTAFALSANAFIATFHSARPKDVLLIVLTLHLARFARVVFAREALIDCIFLGYMVIEMIWTHDRLLALNTLVPATNVVIMLVLVASLTVPRAPGDPRRDARGVSRGGGPVLDYLRIPVPISASSSPTTRSPPCTSSACS